MHYDTIIFSEFFFQNLFPLLQSSTEYAYLSIFFRKVSLKFMKNAQNWPLSKLRRIYSLRPVG